MTPENNDNNYEQKSRSQMKRESLALQKMGEELAKLSPATLEKFPVTLYTQQAIAEYQRITSMEGRRRQMQFIGKLMREEDGNEVALALENFKRDGTAKVENFHKVEKIRDSLLEGDSTALLGLQQSFSPQDFAKTEQLTLAAQKNKNATTSRALFRHLKKIFDEKGEQE